MYTTNMKHALPLWRTVAGRQFCVALAIANSASILLLLTRMAAAGNTRYWYLVWNLFLGWLPLGAAWLMVRRQRSVRWLDGRVVLWAAAWLAFLPNSFYLLSDLIHLRSTGEVSMLYDAVLFCSFIFNGYIAGYLSVLLVHRALLRRFAPRRVAAVLAVVFVLCGYAIYLGRALRWNSWDILLHPLGILFDTSEAILNPLAHPQIFVTTGIFSIVIGSMYLVLWRGIQVLQQDRTADTATKRPR